MKSCPFFTIARVSSHPHESGRAVCQGEDCALWNSRSGTCSFVSVSSSMDLLIAASLAAASIPPLKDDKPPS